MLKLEGECPDCGSTLGIGISGSLASTFKSTIERVMDRDGNAVYCQECGEYKEAVNGDVLED